MTGKLTSYINIYISSASTPEDIKLLEELEKQFSLLKQETGIRFWDKRLILAGTHTQQQIAGYISQAHLILVLLSPDFLHKCSSEMELVTNRMMNREEDVLVIPILMRPTADWKNASIGHLQPLPTDEKPVNDRADREDALGKIAEHIRHIIEQKRLGSSNGVRSTTQLPLSSTLPFAPANKVHSTTQLPQSGNFPSGPSLARTPVRHWQKVGLVFLALVIVLLAIVLVSRPVGEPGPHQPGVPSNTPQSEKIIDPTASSIITTVQTASAIDQNSKLPTTLATSFKLNTDIYTTFQLNLSGVDISPQHPGYVQAKYYKGGKRISTTHVLIIDTHTKTADAFPPFQYYGTATTGAVEVYWCRDKTCNDARLAQKASFTLS